MPAPIYTYALDPTGVNPNNLVQGEKHTMAPRTRRLVATNYGGFFTESLRVFDLANGQELVKNGQYRAVEMFEVPTAKYGKEVCALIEVIDATVSADITITYQAVGGEYSISATAIRDALTNLAVDNRPANWPDIINKPSEFPPTHHLHDQGDVYGFEYQVHTLERIRRAIEVGDSFQHDLIYKYIDGSIALIDYITPAAANALMNNAISTAAADATTKASAAQANAIQTAATDATAKAGTAENNAKVYADGKDTAHVQAADPHTQYVLEGGDLGAGATVTTPNPGDNTTKVSTTAFVKNAVDTSATNHTNASDPHPQYALEGGDIGTGATVSTPTINDETTKVINAAFLKRFGQQYATPTVLNSTVALGNSSAGKIHQLDLTSNYVVTLPPGSAVSLGASVVFATKGSGFTASIAPAAGDTLNCGTQSAVGSVSLRENEWCEATYISANLWVITQGSPVVQTPAQFDDSTRVATTAFVRRRGSQYASATNLTGATTLVAADAGKVFQTVMSSSFTVALPAGSTLQPGVTIGFVAKGAGFITSVTPNVADTITSGQLSGLTALSLTDGDWCELTYWGSNLWVVTQGNTLNNQAGQLVLVMGTVAPNGTIKANGSLLSRTQYPRLWTYAQASGNVLADDASWAATCGAFSPGDGSTTFRIPDLRGYHLRMLDDGRGIDTGRVIGSIQADQFPSHSHSITDVSHNHAVTNGSHAHSATGSDSGHTHAYNNPQLPVAGTNSYQNGPQSTTWRIDNIAADITGLGFANISVTVNGAASNVSLAAANSGITGTNATGTGTETRVKTLAVLACIRY